MLRQGEGLASWDYLKRRLLELGLSEQGGILRSKTNCLRICEGGPIAVVYPEGTWARSAILPSSSASSRSTSSEVSRSLISLSWSIG
jgi:hypothetical protein